MHELSLPENKVIWKKYLMLWVYKDTRGSKFTLPALKKYGLDINDSKGKHITT